MLKKKTLENSGNQKTCSFVTTLLWEHPFKEFIFLLALPEGKCKPYVNQ